MADGKYIDSDKIVARISPQTFIAIFDDAKQGTVDGVNDDAVQQVIDEAEGEVDSYLVLLGLMPLPATVKVTVDRLIEFAAMDYAHSICLIRHQELTKSSGENPKAMKLWTRAEKRMERIKKSLQQLPDVTSETGILPSNTGGFVQTGRPETDDPDIDPVIFRDTGVF